MDNGTQLFLHKGIIKDKMLTTFENSLTHNIEVYFNV
jgi:hypothetical protein